MYIHDEESLIRSDHYTSGFLWISLMTMIMIGDHDHGHDRG